MPRQNKDDNEDTKSDAKKKTEKDEEGPEQAVRQNPILERSVNRYVGNAIMLFLSALSLIVVAAAAITTYETIVRDFPLLWQPTNEYDSLQRIIENILLVAIAAELGLLLLFHRTSAAVEIVIFIIARKMVNPTISSIDLLAGALALAGLIVVRHYYLTDEKK
jgi:hypothetical protein